MHDSPLCACCAPGSGTWTDRRRGRHGSHSHVLAVLTLTILTAAAAGGVAVWYCLNSWISLPLL